MKIKNLKLSVFSLLLLIAWTGCKDDEPLETDPSQIILGKSELVKIGNYPDMRPVENPSGYKEYLPDSVLRQYNYETGEFFYRTYWIDSILHEKVFYQDETAFILTFNINFPDKNTLELETNNMPSIFNNEIYQRIK